MKKRKELDALVSNGKISSSKRINCIKKASGSCSAHELLRHDTDSSDMEDFSILQPRRKSRKKHGSHLCFTSVCLSLCQFILVTSSVLISGALIYMHLGLREDIDLLRAHLQKVEAGNKNTPEALHVIHSSLKQLDSNVTMLYVDVRKNTIDIENITAEVKLLKEVTNNLRESIAAAPAIQQLPKDMHALSESVANFGSKMNALESNVKELKDQQSSLQTTAQNLSGELDIVKITVQELSNSSDIQTKTVANTSGKDSKLQTALQEANQHIDFLQGQLSNMLSSVNQFNTSLSNHLTAYSDLPAKLKTVKDAIVFMNNETQVQNVRLLNLENFLHSNVSLKIDELESGKQFSYKEFDVYVNKSVSEIIRQLLNRNIFQYDPANSLVQPIEKTHDVLVLLAALLKKFNNIPDYNIMSEENATEVVKVMLHKAFDEIYNEQSTIKKTEENSTVKPLLIDRTDKSQRLALEKSVPAAQSNLSNISKLSKSGSQDLTSEDPWATI